jgi:NADPH-dependent 2,4-dienoyl-CoA reductase/sulfur reductase-like enzyme
MLMKNKDVAVVVLAVVLAGVHRLPLAAGVADAPSVRAYARGNSDQGQGSERESELRTRTAPSFGTTYSFDVVVYGATSGGVMAAVAAARRGARVALLDPKARIGGMSAGGLSSTGWLAHLWLT